MTQSIRQSFLDFFKSKGHTIVPSDSLVPSSDPTLLFTSAGMVQFKPHFLQQIPLTFTKATSSQRCVRTTDIDQVGMTPRHLTLFEMLGNFSFGDYFKEDAIAWGWEYLTKTLALPKDRLWITVYKDDDEAEMLWKKLVPASRIVRMGEETNFWTMGPTGPCGPCSEIHWDFVGDADTKGPDDSPRWMEIWNLVFTQFDRQADGKLVPLPKKNIDTGMGLERLTSVVEGVQGNFDTSLFKPLIQFGEETFKYKFGSNPKKDTSLKILSDHLRAVTLLVFDGILPSNEGRGYVLRRLLRRAVRQGSFFNKKGAFLYTGVPLVAELFKETANVSDRVDNIKNIVKQEEERFLETLASGSEKLQDLVKEAKKENRKVVTGSEVFRLYDTFGFPPELTKEMLLEQGITFKDEELEKAKEQAQDKAREGWKGSGAKDAAVYNDVLKKIGPTSFKGYDTLTVTTAVSFLLKDGKPVSELKAGEAGELFTKESPFYPEGGGQVGDKGWIESASKTRLATVADAQKPASGLTSHEINVAANIKIGDAIVLVVDRNHREPTKRHHTATHLLHAALRNILGKNVTQAGSLVAPDRLRFDYTFNRPLTAEEFLKIETMVNEAVLSNWKVEPKVFSAADAKKMGAMALFGEKYGDQVRCLVVSPKGFDSVSEAFSLELCGGTHVSASGDIGGFKILTDSSLAAGVRRIEAIAGLKTIDYLRSLESSVASIASKLKSSPQEISDKISRLLDKQKQLEQDVRDLKLKMAQGGGTESSPAETQTVNGVPLLVKVSENLSVQDLRTLVDRLKQQMKSGVIVAATTQDDEGKIKVSFVVSVTPDIQSKVNAGQLAKAMAAEMGGSGGGRPDFAQGGGQGKDKLDALLKKIPALIK